MAIRVSFMYIQKLYEPDKPSLEVAPTTVANFVLWLWFMTLTFQSSNLVSKQVSKKSDLASVKINQHGMYPVEVHLVRLYISCLLYIVFVCFFLYHFVMNKAA